VSVAARLNAHVDGAVDGRPMVFVHGFGCGQQMWRFVAPAFDDHRVVLLDLAGSGGSDVRAYDAARYDRLEAYAQDVVDLLVELDLDDAVLVGHSVSAMIGVLAHALAPARVSTLVMVAPSARYIDEGDYVGGFSEADIDDLLATMDRNHLGWQAPLAGMVGATAAGGDTGVAAELEESFCRTRPDIARQFASLTFRGDNRADLARVAAPTLVLQSAVDVVAPPEAGRFVHENVRGSQLVTIDTVGHSPHLTAPGATADAIRSFVDGGRA